MKILLVEDEIDFANFLIRGLKYEGYQVEHVADGKEALAEILTKNFDIVILDLGLPSMSGEEVIKKVRAEKNSTPIVVLTALNEVASKTKLLNAGADDYLVKPFSFVELVARIKSILRRSNGERNQSEELVIGNLKLLPNLREVYVGPKKIKLRRKEYALLEYLMRNPNEVINRTTLIERVWDYNARLLSNTVDSHISSLRSKLGRASKPVIETVHGYGYVLRDY